MGNIRIVRGVFDTKLELEHASVAAGFPSPSDDYRHETLDFNRDYIRHPEASFYGDVEGDSMKDAGLFDGDRVIIEANLQLALQSNDNLFDRKEYRSIFHLVVRQLHIDI